MITKWGMDDGESVLLLVGSSWTVAKQAIEAIRGGSFSSYPLGDSAITMSAAAIAIATSYFLVQKVYHVPVYITGNSKTRSGTPAINNLPLSFNSGGVVPISAAFGFLAIIRITEEFIAPQPNGAAAETPHSLAMWSYPESGWYWLLIASLAGLFTFASNFSLLWGLPSADGKSIAQQLRESWIILPGFPPGSQTERRLSRIMLRISLVGALVMMFLAAGIPYLAFLLSGKNLTVSVASIFVFIQALRSLLRKLSTCRRQGSYQGLIKR